MKYNTDKDIKKQKQNDNEMQKHKKGRKTTCKAYKLCVHCRDIKLIKMNHLTPSIYSV